MPESVIGSFADPNDSDNDRISGRVPAGRFGWKARFATLEHVVAAAFANELGLGSARYPDLTEQRKNPSGIELTEEQIRATAAFVRSLPSPARRKQPAAGVGEDIFTRIGCASCHRPAFELDDAFRVGAYTDLLLHDMGPALADGIEEGNASGSEFRTAPLWGVSVTGPPYLHDGRAKSLDEAILAHGGEASRSADGYRSLSPEQRSALLQFLASL